MADRYASLRQGLVGCWIPSISGSGLLLPDLSGRGNNGALTNMDASDWVSSQYGRALDFDGSNDYVATTRASGISSQSTVCVWVYPRDIATYQIVISEDPIIAASLRNFVFGYGLTSGKLIAVDFRGSVADVYESAASLVANTWQHISWTRRTTGMVFHVNGLQSGSTFSYTGAINTNNVATRIGVRELGDGFTNALVDDARIYNRALTEPEIRLLSSEPGIGFKPAKKLSRFSQRFTYKPDKPRNYSVIRNRDPNLSTLRHGLVAAYCPSISGQGNVLPDLVGGNHGTLTNMDASDWVSSGDGRALEFDGTNDVVAASNTTTGNLGTSDATISFWARLNNANAFSTIVCKRASTGGAQWHIDQGYVNNVGSGVTGKQIGLFWYTGVGGLSSANTQSFYTTNDVVDGNWHHIAVRRINGITPAFFIDGVSVAVTAAINGTTNINADQTTDPITIGADRVTGLGGQVAGVLDDIRLYSRALSESEIKLLASKRGIGLQPRNTHVTFTDLGVQKTYSVVRVKETDYGTLRQGLVGAWCPSLPNGGSGNTLPDVSGFNNHGTLVNMAADDWVSGQYGRALDFDGSNDYVNVPHAAQLNLGDNLTVSAWVNLKASGSSNPGAEILSKGFSSGDPYISYGLEVDATVFRFSIGTTGFTNLLSSTTYNLNQWYHVVGTYDKQNMRIFINGIQTNSASQTGTIVYASQPLTIGTWFLGVGSGNQLNGILDDIRIYNRALTDSEIRLLASRPGIGLRQDRDRNTFYQFPSGARRKRILTGMP